MMQTYHFSIETLRDLENYVRMVEQYRICGTIIGENFASKADDILTMAGHWPLTDLKLIVENADGGDGRQIDAYLSKKKLLCT